MDEPKNIKMQLKLFTKTTYSMITFLHELSDGQIQGGKWMQGFGEGKESDCEWAQCFI